MLAVLLIEEAPVTTMKSLGDRLRARRRELDRTIAQVAEAAGLSLPYVSNLERGHGNPTLEALQALAAALEVSVGDLLDTGDGEDVIRDLALADLPNSLQRFSGGDRFRTVVQRLAAAQHEAVDDMRRQVLVGMANAPRRSTGEPTEEDWRRLLDTYTLMLNQDE